MIFFAPLSGDPAVATVATGLDRGEAAGFIRVAGPAGRAIRTGPEGVRFPMLGNFEHTRGSLAFWVRADGAKGGNIDLFDATNFTLRWEPARRLLTFMTGTSRPGDGYQWNYACAAEVRDGFAKWTQVAATWDAERGERRLYLDGREVASAQSDLMRRTMLGEKTRINLPGSKTAQLFFSDLAVWNRELGSSEIRTMAESPDLLTEAAALVPPREGTDEPLRPGLHAGTPATSIVAPGENYAVEFPIENRGASEWAGTVTLSLLDFHESPLRTVTQSVTIPAKQSATLRETFSANEPRIYKVEVRLEGTEVLAGIASFVVWPKDSALSDDSFFGLHVNSWSEDLVAQAARLGFRWNRNHNMLQTTWWPRVQPEPGEFQWLHDPSLALNEKHGFRVLGQFFGTPHWAAAAGPLKPQKVSPSDSPYPYGALPDFDAWREYVRQTVKRYKDRIQLWETGNEPDVSRFFNGSPEQFAELAAITYEMVKATDPNSTVMLAGFAPGWPWVRRTAGGGAFKAADAISLHLYHPAAGDMEEFADRVAATVEFYKDLIRQHGRTEKMPLWQTEGGSSSTTWLRGIHLDRWPPATVLPAMNWSEAAFINRLKIVLTYFH